MGWTSLAFVCVLGFALWQHRDAHEDEKPRRTWKFPVENIAALTVRAARTVSARRIEVRSEHPMIEISGRPRAMQNHYHHEGKGPAQGNLTWVLERVDEKVSLRAFGETTNADGRFVLDDLEIRVPPGLAVQFEAQPPVSE